jgi:hypothetical protein
MSFQPQTSSWLLILSLSHPSQWIRGPQSLAQDTIQYLYTAVHIPFKGIHKHLFHTLSWKSCFWE